MKAGPSRYLIYQTRGGNVTGDADAWIARRRVR
jgi:hypothetical protein